MWVASFETLVGTSAQEVDLAVRPWARQCDLTYQVQSVEEGQL